MSAAVEAPRRGRSLGLTDTQAEALDRLEPRRWLGTAEVGVQGSTITALAHRGLVRRAWTKRPHKRIVARLTPDGLRARGELKAKRLRSAVLEDLPDDDLIAVNVLLYGTDRAARAEAAIAELRRRAKRRAEDEDARTIAALAVLYLEGENAGTTIAEPLRELDLGAIAELILERDPTDEDLERVERALETAAMVGRIVERTDDGLWRLQLGGRR